MDSGEKPNFIQRMTRILGISSSVFVIGLVAWWAFHIGARDASEVPVIAALEGEARVKPEDPGGTVIEHQDLEVNAVLEGQEPSLADEVTIAPSEENILADVEPAVVTEDAEVTREEDTAAIEAAAEDGELRTQSGISIAKPVTRPALLYILPKDQLHPSTLEAQPIGGDSPVLDGIEVSNAAVEVVGAPATLPAIDADINSEPEIETPATDAVEAQPASQAPAQTPAAPAVDDTLGPRLAAGTPLIQLAANPDIEVTRKQWAQLQSQNSDILGDKSLYLETTTVNGTIFYRLRVQGFADAGATQSACTSLLSRNVDCLVVKAK